MSVINPKAGIEEAIPTWLKVDWSAEMEQGIYKDWGKFYSRRRRESNAITYFNKAYDLAPDDYTTLYYRSQSQRKIGKAEAALADSRRGQKIFRGYNFKNNPNNYPLNLEVCDALYELNQFENSKAELHNNTRLFSSNKSKAFEDRLIVVDGNINDACGDGLSPFILENEYLFNQAQELLNSKMKVDKRPLWKILKEQDKCDILSIPEVQEVLLSPREIARRKRAFDIRNQMYMDKSWTDILFLRKLRTNPNVFMEQCKFSNEYLHGLTDKQYEVVSKFVKMIHARSPMYFMRYQKYANKALQEKFREALLFRIQHQTRRNMGSFLRTIARLRAEKETSRLEMYVEDVMGEYVGKKTYRIMPWKFEFLNEVYNTLALALLEQYCVPKNFNENEHNALFSLLHLDRDKQKDIKDFVFGDRSTHRDENLLDVGMSKTRELISRLEKRLIFAKYSIEKCYLYHKISSIHLDSNHFDECWLMARNGIEETSNCNNLVWRFLNSMLIVKSNVSLNKHERVKEALKSAHQIVESLNAPHITEFLDMCVLCNEHAACIKNSGSIHLSKRNSRVSSRLSSALLQ